MTMMQCMQSFVHLLKLLGLDSGHCPPVMALCVQAGYETLGLRAKHLVQADAPLLTRDHLHITASKSSHATPCPVAPANLLWQVCICPGMGTPEMNHTIPAKRGLS